MLDVPGSRIHLSPDAINAVLEHLVNAKGDMQARFENGRLTVIAKGLTLSVDAVDIGPEGVDIRLRLV